MEEGKHIFQLVPGHKSLTIIWRPCGKLAKERRGGIVATEQFMWRKFSKYARHHITEEDFRGWIYM
jgi:hypothetical protein